MLIPIWILIVVAIALIIVLTYIIRRYKVNDKELLEQRFTYIKNEKYAAHITWTCCRGAGLHQSEETSLWVDILDLADYSTEKHDSFDWTKVRALAKKTGRTNVFVEHIEP